MLYRQVIAVGYHTHRKRINAQRGQNVEFVNVKHGGTVRPYRAVNTLRLSYTNQSVNAVQ
jgi:hypothetical protein